MFEYVDLTKVFDKLLLAITCVVVFGFLYSTAESKDFQPIDKKNNTDIFQNDLGNSMFYSLSVQTFKYDYNSIWGKVFILTTIQIILSYVILIM